MQFGIGDDSYPVPVAALHTLDDDLVPNEIGEETEFRGSYDPEVQSFTVEDRITVSENDYGSGAADDGEEFEDEDMEDYHNALQNIMAGEHRK